MSSPVPALMTCPACGADLPSAYLVHEPGGGRERSPEIPLGPAEQVLGRGSECNVRFDSLWGSISRRHAVISREEGVYRIQDAGSRHGTSVNGNRLDPGTFCPLMHGDLVRLGDVEFRFVEAIPSSGRREALPYDQILDLVSRMSVLDEAVVITRALELLKLVSGVDRGFLVGLGPDGKIRDMHALDAGEQPRLSESAVQEALRSGAKVTRIVDAAGGDVPTASMKSLDLRRIWVSPLRSVSGPSILAVYLDSHNTGSPFSQDRERLLDALVEQIGITLRNVLLHEEVVDLNRDLERRVKERTRELEESRTRLIGQDRLVTLGRLVAGIAHELNNPAGAISSLARTQEELLEGILTTEQDLEAAFPDGPARKEARALLEQAREYASSGPLDTRERRFLEKELADQLRGFEVSAADSIARRLARAGVRPGDVDAAGSAFRHDGVVLGELLERVASFARGVGTIRTAAASVARIVDGLKTYSHLDRPEFEEADIHAGIEASLTMMKARIPEAIEIETHYGSVARFRHRPGELTQVWTNLIDNACHAMPEGGTLTIRTSESEDKVSVTIEDTGNGVPNEVAARIFELDVTSRGPGAGLGLGLPICRHIVEKNHGGTITFRSRPGQTRFTVVLPKVPIPTETNE